MPEADDYTLDASPALTDEETGIKNPGVSWEYVNVLRQTARDLYALAAINTQTGTAYTLALTDQGDIVEMNNANPNTVTIPTNTAVAFPVGTIISITQEGAGATTVAGDTGVTLNGVSAGSAVLDAQYAGVSIYKRGTDDWRIQGGHGGVT